MTPPRATPTTIATHRRYRGPSAPRLILGSTAKLAAALIVVSIVAGAFGARWLLLSPDRVLHGWLWQLVTFAFVETSPISLVFGAVILVSIGGALESWWGARTTVRFLVVVTIASGAILTVIALLIPSLRFTYYAGGGAMVSAAWCAYGWSLGRQHSSFYGIVVTGDQLALIGIGMVVVEAALGSFRHALPDAIAIALTYGYVRRR